MSKHKIRERMSRLEAAEHLGTLSKQLREGSVSIGDETKVPVAGDVEFKAELKDDEFELELKWQKAKSARPQPAAIA